MSAVDPQMLNGAVHLETLFLSSALSRCAFLIVFLVLIISQPKSRYLRHWIAALLASTAGLVITANHADSSLLPLPLAFVAYSLFLTSLVTSWTGLRLFYGQAVPLFLIPLFTLGPSALYVLGALLDFPQRVLLSMIYASAAAAAGLALLEILRSQKRLLTQYIVAAAFAGYFLALVVPAVLILAKVLPAAINASSFPAILFDQASSVLVYFGYIAMSNERATLDLRQEATTDLLTKAANRRGGKPVLESLHDRCSDGASCSVWLADIDHFKAVNDYYGHEAGDIVLVAVADRLASSLRHGDTLVRWGGEEFLVVLPNTTLADGWVSAERLRHAIESQPFVLGQNLLTVTLSLGGAEMSAMDRTYDACLQRADEALYLAKKTGRNRVCCQPPSPTQ